MWPPMMWRSGLLRFEEEQWCSVNAERSDSSWKCSHEGLSCNGLENGASMMRMMKMVRSDVVRFQAFLLFLKEPHHSITHTPSQQPPLTTDTIQEAAASASRFPVTSIPPHPTVTGHSASPEPSTPSSHTTLNTPAHSLIILLLVFFSLACIITSITFLYGLWIFLTLFHWLYLQNV